MSKKISLFIKTIKNEIHNIVVDENLSIFQFKGLISEKFNVDPILQRLLYSNNVLDDDNYLHDYNIENNDTIYLIKGKSPSVRKKREIESQMVKEQVKKDNVEKKKNFNERKGIIYYYYLFSIIADILQLMF